jgi:signal peptidase I
MWKRIVAAFLLLVVLTVGSLVVFWVLISIPGRPTKAFTVGGKNMSPTLEPGDRVVCSAAVKPRAGSIVVFKDPLRRLPALISRVVAVGGQSVDLVGGQLVVNGKVVSEPYVMDRPTEPGTVTLPVTLPPDTYWLMGDNRTNSGDSRFFGPVPASSIIGGATVRYWPLARYHRFQ